MKWVGMSPISWPPRVRRIASRSKPAITARRTLTSSNGLIVVFIATQRPPPFGTSVSCSFCLVTTCLRMAGSGEKSPLTMLSPSRILRDATVVSSLPCGMSISSR